MVWNIVIAGVILYLLFSASQLALAAFAEYLEEGGGKALILLVAIWLLAAAAYELIWNRPRPYFLTRSTAAKAIESTAEFQHGTKLYFDIDEVEGVVSGVCHNFRFSSDKKSVWDEYRKSGALKFSPWGDPTESHLDEGLVASRGSMDLSLGDDNFLTDDIEPCAPHAPLSEIGQYELTLGKPIVEVNGIQANGNDATVDFIWYFQSLNKVGRSLEQIKGRKETILSQNNLSTEEKAKAPFWNGSAKMMRFDDGWRVIAIKGLNPEDWTAGYVTWPYGPWFWPDTDFNWGAFDEDENHLSY